MKFQKITETPFCKSGIGKGTKRCAVCTEECKSRILSGPDVTSEIEKQGTIIAPASLSLLLPDEVKTKEALSEYLQKLGHKRGTPEYWEYYKLYSVNLKSKYELLNK